MSVFGRSFFFKTSFFQAFSLLIDGVVHNESHSVALSKLLSSCFVIRGSQLSVLHRLDSQYVVQIHTKLLSWITKRIALHESNKNKKSRNTAILFFKSLHPLLTTMDSRDALKMYVKFPVPLYTALITSHGGFRKAHLDQILAQSKIEVSATSKIWEPQRAYEKRLSTAMAKNKGV
jgi:cohesin complex subunit SA-1/2